MKLPLLYASHVRQKHKAPMGNFSLEEIRTPQQDVLHNTGGLLPACD